MQAMAKNTTHRGNIQAYAEKMGTWANLSEPEKTQFNSGDVSIVKKVLKDALTRAIGDAANKGINGDQKIKIQAILGHDNFSDADLKEMSEIMKNLTAITSLAFNDKKLKFTDN